MINRVASRTAGKGNDGWTLQDKRDRGIKARWSVAIVDRSPSVARSVRRNPESTYARSSDESTFLVGQTGRSVRKNFQVRVWVRQQRVEAVVIYLHACLIKKNCFQCRYHGQVCMAYRLPVSQSICLCLSACQPVCAVSVSVFFCLSVCLPAACMPTYLSTCVLTCIPVTLFVCFSVSLPLICKASFLL